MSDDPVLTIRDLDLWSGPGTALAVLGHPIAHSVSPPMHNAALADLARGDSRFADWRYHRFEIKPAQLARALELFHARNFRGLNLTVPHKVMALEALREIDPPARLIGAVNTLRWAEGGWQGFNTDGYGLASAIRESFGCDLSGATILLLGAGGAARGAAVECLQRGCASLTIANRTPAHGEALRRDLAALAAQQGIPLRSFDPAAPPEGALVINATSAGLRPGDPLPLDLATLPSPFAVYDMIYNPPETPLLAAASRLGRPQANGLGMLVHQGAKALEIWSGVPAARTAPVMARAAQAQLRI